MALPRSWISASPGSQSVFRLLPPVPGQACHWPLVECSAGDRQLPWPIPARPLLWKWGWWPSRSSSQKPWLPEGDPGRLSSGRRETGENSQPKTQWGMCSRRRNPKVTRFTLTTHLFLYHWAWQRGLHSEQLVLSFKDRGLGSGGIMSHKPIKNTSQAARRSVKHDAVTRHSVQVHFVFCSTVFTRALAVLPICKRMLTETPCYFYFHKHTHSQPVLTETNKGNLGTKANEPKSRKVRLDLKLANRRMEHRFSGGKLSQLSSCAKCKSSHTKAK